MKTTFSKSRILRQSGVINEPNVVHTRTSMASSSSSSSSPSPSPSTPSDELKKLLDNALGFIRDGNIIKAHHILNAGRRQHDDSAIFHRIWCPVLFIYTMRSVQTDPEVKKRQTEAAVDSAKRATELSPNNLEFSICYVKHLVFVVDEGLEEAVTECERALAVANPIDFSLGGFREKATQETSDMDGIASRQEELQFLLNTFKNPGLSARMKKTLAISAYTFKIRSHLQSLQTLEEWKDFLRVDIKEFKEGFSNVQFVHEALDFAKANHSWKFWVCPLCCPEPHFADSESQLQHMFEQHLDKPSEELKPKEIDQDLVDKLVKGSWDPIDVQALTKNDDKDWPLSDDTERKTLLKRIKYYIWKLAKDKCLSMRHLDRMVRDATGELQALGVGVTVQSTNCIRFLDSKKLQEEIIFFESLMEACKLGPSEDMPLDIPESDVVGVNLDDSSSYIEFDMKLLPRSEDTSCPDDESRGLPDVDSTLCWIYEYQHPEAQYDAWCTVNKAKTLQANAFLHRLEELYEDLSMRYSDKDELLAYLESLQDLKEFSKCERRDYVAYILSDLLKEAEAFKPSRAVDADTIESESNGDGNKITSSMDTEVFIDTAFQELKSLLEDKLGIIDVWIMKILAAIRTLEHNLACISTFDYLPILATVVQTYLPEALVNKMEEFAKVKPEAASEATLEELLLKAEKIQLQENSRGKSNRNNSKKSKGRNA